MGEYAMHVVINGANRGVGLALCQVAKAKGHTVTALCRTSSESLRDLSVRVVEGVEAKNPPVLDDLESIDWLILNAGIWRDESLDSLNFDTILEQFEVNSLWPLRVFQKLSHALSEGSKVGLMTSLMGSMAENSSGGRYGYRASKAALNAIGISLAQDLKARGIAVALLHPGYVSTDMTQHKGTTSPAESADGLFQVMGELSLQNTGGFWNYRGEALPW